MNQDKEINGIVAPRRIKQWTKMKGENAWTMFKVMAEFVDGFEILNNILDLVFLFLAQHGLNQIIHIIKKPLTSLAD